MVPAAQAIYRDRRAQLGGSLRCESERPAGWMAGLASYSNTGPFQKRPSPWQKLMNFGVIAVEIAFAYAYD